MQVVVVMVMAEVRESDSAGHLVHLARLCPQEEAAEEDSALEKVLELVMEEVLADFLHFQISEE